MLLSSPFRVVLDANVLFPFTLRDTVLRAAQAGFYQAVWSQGILDEMERNLVSRNKMTAVQARRLREEMEKHFPEATVTDHEELVAGLRNDEKDRHVVAAALKSGAELIVTANLKDFDPLPAGMEAQTPDEFLSNLFDLDPTVFIQVLRGQAEDLQHPPVSFGELLERLERSVPGLVASVKMALKR